MSLAICVLTTWCVLIILLLIPKKLSMPDMIFLFFINTIFELSLFTIISLNFEWIVVNKSVEKSLADLDLRLLEIPLLLLITANILLYSWKFLKWAIVAAILLSFVPMQWLLERMDVIATPRWNELYTIILFGIYILFSSIMAQFILYVGKKEAAES